MLILDKENRMQYLKNEDRDSDSVSPIGLNRGHDNISNTIAAAQVAKSSMTNLLAIELGNEPECRFLFPAQVGRIC